MKVGPLPEPAPNWRAHGAHGVVGELFRTSFRRSGIAPDERFGRLAVVRSPTLRATAMR